MPRTVFTSRRSFEDAENKAKVRGYKAVDKVVGRRGEFIVFAVPVTKMGWV